MTVEDRLKKAFIAGMDVLGINALMRPWYSGIGVIFALHRVVEPGTPVLLTGNVITTSFLDEVLRYVKRTQWDIIPLSEACLRLHEGSDRPFVCFTFDDGYADNLTLALPIFRAHSVPLSVFPCTGFLDRGLDPETGRPNENVRISQFVIEYAWLRNDPLEFHHPGLVNRVLTGTLSEQMSLMDTLLWLEAKDPDVFARSMSLMLKHYGLNPTEILSTYFLSWQQAKSLASDPLVEIGSHSFTHRPLARLPCELARQEMAGSRARLEKELSVSVKYFAYPYGGSYEAGSREFRLAQELGFTASITARFGNIFPEHAKHMQCLPRVCLSMVPHAASRRFVKAALYGSRNGLMNRFSRVITE